jgi:DNA primase
LYSEKFNIIRQSLGSHYESNDELLFHCPKCNHHKKKLSVNIEKSVFKCWICDYKGTSLESLIRDRTLRSEWRALTQQVDITRFDDLFGPESSPSPKTSRVDFPEYFSSLTSPILSGTGKRAKKYLTDRGITNSQIYLYKMGFCFHGAYENRVIVPSFNSEGVLNYFIARSFVSAYNKYKNPPCTKDVVFNELFIDWSKPIVLVEGFFDSLKYENSIPVLGSTLNTRSSLFNRIVNNCSTVYLCLDSDAREKELKIAKNLLDFGIKVCKIEIYEYSDLGEVPNRLLSEYKKRASLITRDDYLLQKINFGG